MSDARILHLVREVVGEFAGAPAAVVEKVDSLHTELHALATKVSELEKLVKALTPNATPARAATRKAPSE